MREILMSNVSFSMQHTNGSASVVVPVWYVMLYTIASMFWPAVAVYLMIAK